MPTANPTASRSDVPRRADAQTPKGPARYEGISTQVRPSLVSILTSELNLRRNAGNVRVPSVIQGIVGNA